MMSKKGILKPPKEVSIATLINQGYDEASLAARRPSIRSLQVKAYLKAPNRHRFGIHGITNVLQAEQEEESEPEECDNSSKKRKTRVRFGRYDRHDYDPEPDEEEYYSLKLTERRPWLVYFHHRSARDRWAIAHELNAFKRDEMAVHPGSTQNTGFIEPPSVAEVAREIEEMKRRVCSTEEMLEACRLVKGSPDLTVEELLVKCLDDEFKAMQVQSVSVSVATAGKKRSGHCRRNAALCLQDLLN